MNPVFNVSSSSSSVSESSADVDIDIKMELPNLQDNFGKLKRELIKAEPELKEELKEIDDALMEVTPDDAEDKQAMKKPMNRLARFLKELADDDSPYSKVIKGTKKGIELAQKVARVYNNIAGFVGAPTVPSFLLGKEKKSEKGKQGLRS